MSMVDNYDVICNNCGHISFAILYGEFDCPKCGKRWIIDLRSYDEPDPKNRKRRLKGVRVYMNGCKHYTGRQYG